jgi:hypothetical protein
MACYGILRAVSGNFHHGGNAPNCTGIRPCRHSPITTTLKSQGIGSEVRSPAIRTMTTLRQALSYLECLKRRGALQRAKIYFAVDIDFDSLLYIHRLGHPNVVPILASIDDLPLKSGAVDPVICLEVIEHIENDRQAFVELGTQPAQGWPDAHDHPDGDTLSIEDLPPPRLHLRHYRPRDLASLVETQCGSMKVETIASWFPFWWLADYVERMGREKKSRLAKALFRAAHVVCNFGTNILHAVAERTPYRKKDHLRLVASCVK